MSEIEVVTLRRAALALLLISVVRWWTTPDDAIPVPKGRTAVDSPAESLAQLAERTRAASDDAEGRARPLESGERIDPNLANEADLDRLPGVGASTASAIAAARAAGAVFRNAGDLLRVRGIGPRTVARMEPHLTFEGARAVATIVPGALPRTAPDASRSADVARSTKPVTPIDVNRASAELLAELPGIGPTLAARIVETRRRKAFRTLDDLTRVSGIGPSTVSRLVGRAVVGRGAR